MRVLIIGSGGREHALAWAISASPLLTALFVAPAIPAPPRLRPMCRSAPMTSPVWSPLQRLERIDLVIPGPEAPLVAGIADALAVAGIRCCGPSAAAAALEGSKKFTKEIADLAGIPTAAWESFSDADEAHDYIEEMGAPIVIKADGLAAGKGVVVAETLDERMRRLPRSWKIKSTARQGLRVVIEECLVGEEISVFALCDGLDALYLGCAADHKRAFDNDVRSQYRRHGRDFAAALGATADYRQRDGADYPPGAGRHGRARHAVPGLSFRRADVDRNRTQA